jgi:hypothetical protein
VKKRAASIRCCPNCSDEILEIFIGESVTSNNRSEKEKLGIRINIGGSIESGNCAEDPLKMAVGTGNS